MKRGTEIVGLRKLIILLEKAGKKNDAPIWKRAAFYLLKPKRQRMEVNLNRINRIAVEGDVLLVPGKVLGIGKLTKKVKIAAYSFSKSAIENIKKTGSESISIEKLVLANPKGAKIRLLI